MVNLTNGSRMVGLPKWLTLTQPYIFRLAFSGQQPNSKHNWPSSENQFCH